MVTPEYNGSIPGVLKNAIDWASALHRGSAFRNKTVAVAGASTGQFGALWAQMDLRKVLGIAGARVIEGELPVAKAHERFDADGPARSTRRVAERLRAHLDALVFEAAPVLRPPRAGDASRRAHKPRRKEEGPPGRGPLDPVTALDW